MKTKFAASCVVIATLLAPVAAYAADADSGSARTTNVVKDAVITTDAPLPLASGAEPLNQRGAPKVCVQ